jgi:hypothetical protein
MGAKRALRLVELMMPPRIAPPVMVGELRTGVDRLTELGRVTVPVKVGDANGASRLVHAPRKPWTSLVAKYAGTQVDALL